LISRTPQHVLHPARRHAGATGLVQRTSLNRAKSLSSEHTSSPCSMASAARCASLTMLPRSWYRLIRSPECGVPRTLPRDPGDLGFQPVRDETGRLLRGQRVRGGSLVGADPEECHERMPREADPPSAVELAGQPGAGPLVERADLIDRIKVGRHSRWLPDCYLTCALGWEKAQLWPWPASPGSFGPRPPSGASSRLMRKSRAAGMTTKGSSHGTWTPFLLAGR
jgi:hypothetical protein